jgi:hypothetical protein
MNAPMRSVVAVVVVAACLGFCPDVCAGGDRAREIAVQKTIPKWRYAYAGMVRRSLDHTPPEEQGLPLRAAAAVDTTVLAAWTFGAGLGCDVEGWTSVDRTAQEGTYFHVDDFAGLGGGDFGQLYPLEGNQSIWCGLRPGQTHPALCAYATLPGYGNNWNQFLRTRCLNTTGDVVVDYLISWHSENGYDYTYLEYRDCDDPGSGILYAVEGWDGMGSGVYSTVIADSLMDGDALVRFRFYSDLVYSDEDGLWDSDGGVILDSLTVSDAAGVVLPTETFEDEGVGATATSSGDWIADVPPGYGDFAGLFNGITQLQFTWCLNRFNPSCMWGFIAGSTADYACGGYPQQAAVPRENERGQYILNDIWSPWVPLAGEGAQLEIAFDVYRDLTLDGLVFYQWHVRFRDEGLCPGEWKDRDWVFWNFRNEERWFHHVEPVGDLVDPETTEIQLALGVIDMCPWWCGIYGTGGCHSNAPYFDNVVVRKLRADGPQWMVRDVDLFQDTFAADGTTTGAARIDAAIDILRWSNPMIHPGDSTVVTVSDLEVGLAPDPYTGFGSAVYTYVSVWNGIDPYPGDAYTDDTFRWPVVDSLVHDGRTWYCVRMDTVFEDGAARASPVENQFCIDLDDDRFVPGDTINFFFAAKSNPPESYTTYWSPFTGTTDNLTDALDEPAECTILPAAGWKRGGEILYVDGYNGMGAQPFFDTAFSANGILWKVDRYDIRGPEERAGNHPGARVVDVAAQLIPCYRVIVWNTGDLRRGLVGDGDPDNEKSDDAGMLLEFLDDLTNSGGVYLSGDNIAEEWLSLSNDAIPLRDTYIPHLLVTGDHNLYFANSPLVIGDEGGPFDNWVLGPDTTYALSLCPDINDFDVIEPQASSTQLMHYDGGSPGMDGAVIGKETTNPQGKDVRVALSGFSFHSIRDDRPIWTMDRFVILRTILTWMGLNLPVPVDASAPPVNRLAQNYPNPFNPTTTIEFCVKERTRVTLRVYNVRGQLVKTLVNGERAAGIVHRVEWSGVNTAGQRVASGVYFYRLATKGYTKTRKMLLLK